MLPLLLLLLLLPRMPLLLLPSMPPLLLLPSGCCQDCRRRGAPTPVCPPLPASDDDPALGCPVEYISLKVGGG